MKVRTNNMLIRFNKLLNVLSSRRRRNLFLFLFLLSYNIHAQTDTIIKDSVSLKMDSLTMKKDTVLIPKDSLTKKYKFLRTDLNHLENNKVALSSFYEKLISQKKSHNHKISIVHIGDSHLQADFFSGEVRKLLQQQYGNAGRGLMFPFKLANTNGTGNFRSSSTSKWDSKRNVMFNNPMPIGVCGITIRTTDPKANINLNIYDTDSVCYAFNKLTLFHDQSAFEYDYFVCDTSGFVLGYINSCMKRGPAFVSEVLLDTMIHQCTINAYKKDAGQTQAQIYGILLENGSGGILYNTIGVNGAQFSDYNSSIYFQDQLSALQPDLVIVSLGTNDAYNAPFNKDFFLKQVDTLITRTKRANPSAAILITTPADSWRNYYYKNPDMKTAAEILKEYCKKNNLAFWDFYEIMGGYNSVYNWYLSGLSQYDHIHFTNAGYQLQAKLLYDAIENGVKKYESLRHK